MRPSLVAAALLSVAQYATAQTNTDCNPTEKSCPSDPALGGTHKTDFTSGSDDFWSSADGTDLTYDDNGASFVIKTATNAPTITSSKYIFFGKVTIVAKASSGTAIVSSVVFQSDDLDEIDWEWLGNDPNNVQTNFFGKGNTTTYDRAITVPVSAAVDDWHTYTVDWTSDAINWSVDGSVVRTLAYDDPLTIGGANYPQSPMKVKLGTWVGCSEADSQNSAKQGTCEWAGGVTDFSDAPFTMYVKSVTVEDYGCATSYEYGDTTGSYTSIKSVGGCDGSDSSSSSSSSSSSAASSTSSKASSTEASSTEASSEASSTGASSKVSSTDASSAEASTTAVPSASKSSTPVTGSNSTSAGSTGSGTGSTSTSTSSASPVPSLNAASGLQRLSTVDYLVALGLGLGYFIM